MGKLATKDMLKRKGSPLEKAHFDETFTKWMPTSMHAKVRASDSRAKPRPVVVCGVCGVCVVCGKMVFVWCGVVCGLCGVWCDKLCRFTGEKPEG